MNARKSKELRKIAREIAGTLETIYPDDYIYANKRKATIILNFKHGRAVYQKLKQVKKKLSDTEFKVFVDSQRSESYE